MDVPKVIPTFAARRNCPCWLDLRLWSEDAAAVYRALAKLLDDPATDSGARMGLVGLACQLHNALSRRP
jgi:hypothetical protein